MGIETEWENPDNIVGPKEKEIEFDKILGQGKPRTKTKVYRLKLSQDVIPLAHSSNSNNYPTLGTNPASSLLHGRLRIGSPAKYNLCVTVFLFEAKLISFYS